MLTNEGRTKALLFCFFPLLGNEKTLSKPSALPNQNFKMLWAIATHNHKGGGKSKTLVGTFVNDILSKKSFEDLAFKTSYILLSNPLDKLKPNK